MPKKLTFYKKNIQPCFFPHHKIDFTRRENYAKQLHLSNQIIFSAILWLFLWKIIDTTAIVFFEIDLWWFIELISSIILTIVILKPILNKTTAFKKSLNTNFLRFILQLWGLFYLINLLWIWIKKIEHEIK